MQLNGARPEVQGCVGHQRQNLVTWDLGLSRGQDQRAQEIIEGIAQERYDQAERKRSDDRPVSEVG